MMISIKIREGRDGLKIFLFLSKVGKEKIMMIFIKSGREMWP